MLFNLLRFPLHLVLLMIFVVHLSGDVEIALRVYLAILFFFNLL